MTTTVFVSHLVQSPTRDLGSQHLSMNTCLRSDRPTEARPNDELSTADTIPPPVLHAGAIVAERYLPFAPIGEGGSSTVWEAEDLHTGRRVALKLAHHGAHLSREALARFEREARALTAMRHPHVVEVLDHGIEPALGPYLAMELLRGPSLEDIAAEERVLDLRALIDWLAPVADALDAVHERGLVHRDVKPANIVRADRDGPVKLVDFGLVVRIDGRDRVTRRGGVVGTPHYLAPEQAQGAVPNAASDIYSLAVVAYELLAGALPHDGETALDVLKAKVASPAPPLAHRTGRMFNVRLERAFETALHLDPRERPVLASAFIASLRACVRR